MRDRKQPRDSAVQVEQIRTDVCRRDPRQEGGRDAGPSTLALALGRGLTRINGVTQYLWRAVDHEGEVLESLLTKTRDRKAAQKFLKKSMKRHGRPEVIVTDRLRSYGAALKELCRGDDREMRRWFNNRAENLHMPF